MNKTLKIAVILSAVDQMSRVIDTAVNSSQARLRSLTDTMRNDFRRGSIMMATGVGLAASMAPAISAFAELENSSTRLETSMMRVGGVTDKLFKPVNDLAISLGAKLPGTTADFQDLFRSLLDGGVQAQSIINGVGESAAYLSVALEMPYRAAGEFAARMKIATGTADNDFMALMDTLARTKQIGVNVDEMMFAFGRSGGALKLMGVQGLQASKDMSVLFATLIRGGMSGETAGTGVAAVFNSMLNPDKINAARSAAAQFGISLEFMRNGRFLGVDNMIRQLDKLRVLSSTERFSIVNALAGSGQDAQILQRLISAGSAGFDELRGKMEIQASLNDKVNKQLGTLSNIWEATSGNFTNMLAAFGASMAPMLKAVSVFFGDVANAMQRIATNNPFLFKLIGTVIGLASAALVLGGAVYVMAGAWAAAKIGLILFAGGVSSAWTFLVVTIPHMIRTWTVGLMLWANTTKVGTAIQWAWNAAMAANPAVWITVAIIALIGVVALLIVKWKEITAWFKGSSPLARALAFSFNILVSPIMFVVRAIRALVDNWDAVKGFFKNIIKETILLPIRLFEAGVNMVSSIKNGIASKWGDFKNWWGDKIQTIRDYLPFSPAKTGPLKDLHKLKFVETIAAGIRPAPLIRAVSGLATAAVVALGAPRTGLASTGSGVPAGGSFNISINVNVMPGASGNPSDIRSAVREMIPEIKSQLSAIKQREEARKY